MCTWLSRKAYPEDPVSEPRDLLGDLPVACREKERVVGAPSQGDDDLVFGDPDGRSGVDELAENRARRRDFEALSDTRIDRRMQWRPSRAAAEFRHHDLQQWRHQFNCH